jgi:uracil-DNA glycosylase
MELVDRIPSDWKLLLNNELNKPYFKELTSFVTQQYNEFTCYPPQDEIFNTLTHCAFKDIKVVIIGQDPYHQYGQANGLAFSVKQGVKHPPSLVNIFKEIKSDIGTEIPVSGDLTRWANQGVLLLNSVLTVRDSEANSHQKKGWEKFIKAILTLISNEKENVIFMLWGSSAQKNEKLIHAQKHYILKSGHPSPLSANRGFWFGNKHFSKANTYLKEIAGEGVDW